MGVLSILGLVAHPLGWTGIATDLPYHNCAVQLQGDHYNIGPTPLPFGLFYSDIASNRIAISEAQWDAYTDSIKGFALYNWTGTILRAYNRQLSKDVVQVEIDMGSKLGSMNLAEAIIDVSEAEALQMSKGKMVKFSGTIKQIR